MEIKRTTRFFSTCLLIVLFAFSLQAKEQLIVFRSAGTDFEDAVKGMSFELEYDFDIHDVVLEKGSTEADIKKSMDKIKPAVVVLMNNVPIKHYTAYQKGLGAQDKHVPTVSLMAILVENAISEIKNANAISFEIPLVTSAVSVRSTYGADKMKRIGVVYRGVHDDFIAKNKEFCAKEGIELVLSKVEGTNSKLVAATKKGLKTLLKKEKVDAIWVPVDNGLLIPTLQKAWLPLIKTSKVPVIVGTKNLVKPAMPFGNYAVLPDYVALGSQAASIVYDIMDNDWAVYTEGEAQPPLSVKTYLYYPDAKANYGLNKDEIMTVDEFLEKK